MFSLGSIQKYQTFQRNRCPQLQVTVNMRQKMSLQMLLRSLMSSESSQNTIILLGTPRKPSCHERIKNFLAQAKNCNSTAENTTCFATMTKRLKNYNKYLKCLPGSSVGIGTRYRPDGPGDRIPAEGDNLRTRPHQPWDPPSLLYNGNRFVPGDKAAGM